jgi:hypothetical protein
MFAKRFSDGKSKAEKEIKKSNKSYLIPPDSLFSIAGGSGLWFSPRKVENYVG